MRRAPLWCRVWPLTWAYREGAADNHRMWLEQIEARYPGVTAGLYLPPVTDQHPGGSE